MNAFGDCSYVAICALSIALLAALIIVLRLLFAEYAERKGWGRIAFTLALELIGAALLGEILISARWAIALKPPAFAIDTRRFFSPGARPPLLDAPAVFVYLAVAAILLYALLRLGYLRRTHAPGIDSAAVKEAFDNLPSGVCFADSRGVVFLCNRQMHVLSHFLIGDDLQYLSELTDALNSPPPGVESVDVGARVFRFPDGRAWQFAETALKASNGKTHAQVRAADVTQILEKKAELTRERQTLHEINGRARKLYGELDRIVREEETLAMKMRIHDDIGASIISAKQTLARARSLDELRESAEIWRRTADELEIADRAGRDDFETAADDAARIGVALILEGELPQSAEMRALIIKAARECVTNCARHADGTAVRVAISNGASGVSAIITNDGKSPEGEVCEGGGLSTLRSVIENQAGKMLVRSYPAFELRILLPEERCDNGSRTDSRGSENY